MSSKSASPGPAYSGPGSLDPARLGPAVPEVDVGELEVRLGEGALLLDVREPLEVEEARVPGGLRIPLQSVPDRLDEIPIDGILYVICAAGGRSRTAAEFLRSHGIDAVNVAGGTNAWAAAGFDTESGPVASGDTVGGDS